VEQLTVAEAGELLGTTSSDEGEVRAAFKRKAKSLHPDLPGGSHIAMITLQAACETLLNQGNGTKRIDKGLDEFIGAFEAAVRSMNDPAVTDLVSVVKLTLTAKAGQLKTSIETVKQVQARYEAIKARLHCTVESDPAGRLLDQQIASCRLELVELQNRLVDIESAQTIAERYTYDATAKRTVQSPLNSWTFYMRS
jgi:YD repeat-containing protein